MYFIFTNDEVNYDINPMDFIIFALFVYFFFFKQTEVQQMLLFFRKHFCNFILKCLGWQIGSEYVMYSVGLDDQAVWPLCKHFGSSGG